MKRYAVAMFGLLMLAGCGDDSQIEDAVKKSLIDPDSAKFGEIVKYTDKDGYDMACVMVNAKNTLGGYVGESIVNVEKKKDGTWRAIGQGLEGYDCDSYVKLRSK